MEYNVFLYDFDNRPFLKEEVNFYKRFVKEQNIKTYLEYGVGTGRILSVLMPKLDYAVGIDISKEMLEACRRKMDERSNYKLYRKNFLDFSSNEVFDLLAIPFNSFHHILKRNDQIMFLSKVRKSLGKGSFFILDTVNYEVAQPLHGLLNEWRLDYSIKKNEVLVNRYQILTKKNLTNKTLEKSFKYEVFTRGVKTEEKEYAAKMKFSSYSDIEHLLNKAGLKIVKVFSDYKFSEGDTGRKAIYLIKRKYE